MFILSQKGMRLIDITGAVVYVDCDEVMVSDLEGRSEIPIGTYGTVENAKAVVRKIAAHIAANTTQVFKMPKRDEE